MKIALILLSLLLSIPSFGQKKKTKNSYARGTLFGYWGYNRSIYSKSTIHFAGNGYDFKMKGVAAHDNPTKQISTYFTPNSLTISQYNARIGYYFKDHWAVSFGIDHMKYVMNTPTIITMNGNVDPGTDASGTFSGSYENAVITTDKSTFHYENVAGLNYLRLEFTRTDQWYATKYKDFAFSTNLGIGTGPLLSYTNFNFAGRQDAMTASLSGYALSGHIAARFEFFKHVFIQTNFSGGMMHQVNVKTRPSSFDATAKASQFMGYGQLDVVLGFLFYIRPTNSCNSCPHW